MTRADGFSKVSHYITLPFLRAFENQYPVSRARTLSSPRCCNSCKTLIPPFADYCLSIRIGRPQAWTVETPGTWCSPRSDPLLFSDFLLCTRPRSETLLFQNSVLFSLSLPLCRCLFIGFLGFLPLLFDPSCRSTVLPLLKSRYPPRQRFLAFRAGRDRSCVPRTGRHTFFFLSFSNGSSNPLGVKPTAPPVVPLLCPWGKRVSFPILRTPSGGALPTLPPLLLFFNVFCATMGPTFPPSIFC